MGPKSTQKRGRKWTQKMDPKSIQKSIKIASKNFQQELHNRKKSSHRRNCLLRNNYKRKALATAIYNQTQTLLSAFLSSIATLSRLRVQTYHLDDKSY